MGQHFLKVGGQQFLSGLIFKSGLTMYEFMSTLIYIWLFVFYTVSHYNFIIEIDNGLKLLIHVKLF